MEFFLETVTEYFRSYFSLSESRTFHICSGEFDINVRLIKTINPPFPLGDKVEEFHIFRKKKIYIYFTYQWVLKRSIKLQTSYFGEKKTVIQSYQPFGYTGIYAKNLTEFIQYYGFYFTPPAPKKTPWPRYLFIYLNLIKFNLISKIKIGKGDQTYELMMQLISIS